MIAEGGPVRRGEDGWWWGSGGLRGQPCRGRRGRRGRSALSATNPPHHSQQPAWHSERELSWDRTQDPLSFMGKHNFTCPSPPHPVTSARLSFNRVLISRHSRRPSYPTLHSSPVSLSRIYDARIGHYQWWLRDLLEAKHLFLKRTRNDRQIAQLSNVIKIMSDHISHG